ncbi:MAG: hypothetical protein F4W89_07900 [Acidobacteria bacterium]|nr:hypothetical protein [Acidobacteriota bacterium]
MKGLRIGLAIVALLAAPPVAAQTSRRAATLDAINQHPFFFHGQEVVLVAEAVADQVLTWLVSEDDSVRILALDVPPPPAGVREPLEVVGTFFDVGRLDETDQRLAGLPIRRISDELLQRPWPTRGELPILIATESRPAEAATATTLRSIVLDPVRYENDGVTVIGRFRGRNLYGDMPEAPDESRWDFVLRSADAAIWVVGMEPKGDDFELDILARRDTGRWLEVTGSVRIEDGMVLVDAGRLTLAEPGADRPADTTTTASAATRLPPPEVIFTAPLANDIDVPPDGNVRVQFSRDMDAESFEGKVRARYGQGAATEGAEIPVTIGYRGRNRVLEVRFEQELKRFQSVTVELLDGISANDGTPLPPWTITFFVGG